MLRIHFSLSFLLLVLVSLNAAANELPDSCLGDTPVTADTAIVTTLPATVDTTATLPADTAYIGADQEAPQCCFQIGPSYYRKYRGMDFSLFKNTTNPSVKPYTFMQDQTWVGIPVFLAGLIAKSEKEAFQQDYSNMTNTKIRLVEHFHSEVDNYTQFSGIALTAGLKLAGVEGRSSWPRLFASSIASYAVMAGFVNGIKYTAKELRPDYSTHNSWPSGHTATAFVGATILHKEYGLTRSPWYSIAGYTVATATGVMRVLNNRHWISDVLSGAGIGILSTELAYGICDLLFKQRGLLMNDLSYYPDMRTNPSFFSISMGIGLGNKNLVLPEFVMEVPEMFDDGEKTDVSEPIHLQFRSATAVGAEGAWFFCPYVGIGGRLRVKSSPINGWKSFAQFQEDSFKELFEMPDFLNSINYIDVDPVSDHITEFAADAGVYFSLPLSSRFAIGSKLLIGRSVMDDIDVNAKILGNKLDFNFFDPDKMFTPTDQLVYGEWDLIDVHASNSMKFGSGLSLTYAHKNSFSWRIFCDYDYAHKTFTASYTPMGFIEILSPDMYSFLEAFDFDLSKPLTSTARKHLHQWVLGGALCVSF